MSTRRTRRTRDRRARDRSRDDATPVDSVDPTPERTTPGAPARRVSGDPEVVAARPPRAPRPWPKDAKPRFAQAGGHTRPQAQTRAPRTRVTDGQPSRVRTALASNNAQRQVARELRQGPALVNTTRPDFDTFGRNTRERKPSRTIGQAAETEPQSRCKERPTSDRSGPGGTAFRPWCGRGRGRK